MMILSVPDDFKQKSVATFNAKTNTIGAYIQQTWDISDNIKDRITRDYDTINTKIQEIDYKIPK